MVARGTSGAVVVMVVVLVGAAAAVVEGDWGVDGNGTSKAVIRSDSTLIEARGLSWLTWRFQMSP